MSEEFFSRWSKNIASTFHHAFPPSGLEAQLRAMIEEAREDWTEKIETDAIFENYEPMRDESRD